MPLFFIACQSPKEPIVSYVESPHITIPNSRIDQLTKQDLFDNLYEIYQIRKETIEEQIRASLLSTQKEDSYKPMDSIITKYNIKINLKEPTAPFIPIKDEYIQWIGQTESPTNIIEIINPECDLCQIVHKRYKTFLKHHPQKIKIGYVIFSNEPSLSMQALNYASKYNKFSELLQEFMYCSELDSITIFNKMLKVQLDTIKFQEERIFLEDKCLNQIINLRTSGISKTPTILLNNHLVYNPLDTTYIIKNMK